MYNKSNQHVSQLYVRFDEVSKESVVLKKEADGPVNVQHLEGRLGAHLALTASQSTKVEEIKDSGEIYGTPVKRKNTKDSEPGALEELDEVDPLPPSTRNAIMTQRNPLEVLEQLGKGGFGSVFKVRHLLDGQFYALKKVRI